MHQQLYFIDLQDLHAKMEALKGQTHCISNANRLGEH